jgi:hypothetical protein
MSHPSGVLAAIRSCSQNEPERRRNSGSFVVNDAWTLIRRLKAFGRIAIPEAEQPRDHNAAEAIAVLAHLRERLLNDLKARNGVANRQGQSMEPGYETNGASLDNLPRLNEAQLRALNFIKENGPVVGKEIAKHVDVTPEHFRRWVQRNGVLTAHGVVNDRHGDGYRCDQM